jgi:hypothetical protein
MSWNEIKNQAFKPQSGFSDRLYCEWKAADYIIQLSGSEKTAQKYLNTGNVNAYPLVFPKIAINPTKRNRFYF